MASPKFPATVLAALSLLFLLSQPAYSQTCKTQTFANKKTFDHCRDLPYLSAYLHWTYDESKSSLSMAFMAPPAKTGGWVGWGINPNGTGMIGSQALVAFKQSNGATTVKTFPLKSYTSVQEGTLSFNVSDLSSESSGNNITIFANWSLPKETKINHVWQAGPGVSSSGSLQPHATTGDNLKSVGTLDLTQTAVAPSGEPASAPSGEPPSAPSGGPPSAPSPSGSSGGGGAQSPSKPSDGGKSLMKSVGLSGVLVVGGLGFLF